MKGINTITKVITKAGEVLHWAGAALMIAATICTGVNPQLISNFVSYGAELNVYGFEVNAAVSNGAIDMTAARIFFIGAFIILCLMAMVFRNLYLITKKSEGTTPFQPDNVRMFREIGYFSVGVPVIGLIMSVITRLVVGVEVAEISCSLWGLIIGVVVLCVSQFFAHGLEMEKDLDGLL